MMKMTQFDFYVTDDLRDRTTANSIISIVGHNVQFQPKIQFGICQAMNI